VPFNGFRFAVRCGKLLWMKSFGTGLAHERATGLLGLAGAAQGGAP
jgi:hypothetical protein